MADTEALLSPASISTTLPTLPSHPFAIDSSSEDEGVGTALVRRVSATTSVRSAAAASAAGSEGARGVRKPIALQRPARESFDDSSDGDSPVAVAEEKPAPDSLDLDALNSTMTLPSLAALDTARSRVSQPPAAEVMETSMLLGEAKDDDSVGSADSQQADPVRLLGYVKAGDLDMVQKLLEAGTPWDCATTVNVLRPIHVSVLFGKHQVLALLLKAKGAKVDLPDRQLNTALHFAATDGSVRMVRMLLAAKAKLDAQNRFGETPLMKAAYWGHKEVIRDLLRAGADAGLVAVDGGWKGRRAVDLIEKTSLKVFFLWKKRRDFETALPIAQGKASKFVPTYPEDVTDEEEVETDVEAEEALKEEAAKAAADAAGGGAGGKKAGAKASKPSGTKSPLSKKK